MADIRTKRAATEARRIRKQQGKADINISVIYTETNVGEGRLRKQWHIVCENVDGEAEWFTANTCRAALVKLRGGKESR